MWLERIKKGRRSSVSFVKWISRRRSFMVRTIKCKNCPFEVNAFEPIATSNPLLSVTANSNNNLPYPVPLSTTVAFKMALPEVSRVPKFKWIYYDTTIEFLVFLFIFFSFCIWIDYYIQVGSYNGRYCSMSFI